MIYAPEPWIPRKLALAIMVGRPQKSKAEA
jgi:hypothetical protein